MNKRTMFPRLCLNFSTFIGDRDLITRKKTLTFGSYNHMIDALTKKLQEQ